MYDAHWWRVHCGCSPSCTTGSAPEAGEKPYSSAKEGGELGARRGFLGGGRGAGIVVERPGSRGEGLRGLGRKGGAEREVASEFSRMCAALWRVRA